MGDHSCTARCHYDGRDCPDATDDGPPDDSWIEGAYRAQADAAQHRARFDPMAQLATDYARGDR